MNRKIRFIIGSLFTVNIFVLCMIDSEDAEPIATEEKPTLLVVYSSVFPGAHWLLLEFMRA